MACDLDHRWPFSGHVAHSVTLGDEELDLRLQLTAGNPDPAHVLEARERTVAHARIRWH